MALIAGNGNIVKAAEVLSEASEKAEEETTEETLEDSEEEATEEVSEENEEASVEEPSAPPAKDISGEASEETSEEASEEKTEEVSEESSEETIETSKKYAYEKYEIDFVVTGQWENGYTANVIIRNKGTEIIHDWTMVMEGDLEIANLWSGEIISSDEQKIIVNNLEWNQDIYPKGEITLGFTSNVAYNGIPKACILIDKTEKVVSDGYEVIFEKTDIWNEGYTGKITITNTSDSIIKDWRLAFESEDEIISVWDAELLENAHPSYLVGGPSHNQNIEAGQSVSFGLSVSGMNPDSVIANVTLSQFEEPKSDEEEYNPGRELEPLQSIGEAYYKDVTEADVILNEDTGILYVKNQILISGVPGEPKKLFEDLAAELGADIVGYLEITNDYQLEFVTNKSAEELDAIIEQVKKNSFVSYASLNIASYIEGEAVSDDEMYCDGKTLVTEEIQIDNENGEIVTEYVNTFDEEKPDIWDEEAPNGDNWGLEALRVPSAWEYKEDFEPVKVGVIDFGLNSEHEDIVFDDIINEASSIEETHGTGVAGVIAAQHNNGIGISGVATDVRLYGYDFSDRDITNSIEKKVVYAHLICNDVKVINISIGYGNSALAYACSRGNKRALNYMNESAYQIGEFLDKLVELNYDFVIVTSAGNLNNRKFVKDDEALYGYREAVAADKKIENKGVWAEYGSDIRAIKKIDFPKVYDRIIVVGAIFHSYIGTMDKTIYDISAYSNIGERVDVVAPADEIVITVPTKYAKEGYIQKQSGGTSIAAPHITGIVALMYQINPSLQGDVAKKIICNNFSTTVRAKSHMKEDGTYYTYKLPDAAACVKSAKYKQGEPYIVSGTLTGTIVDENDNPVKGAKICATPADWTENVMKPEQVIVETDENGKFLMKLEEQSYQLIVSTKDYVPYISYDWIFVGSEKISDIGKIKLEDSVRNVMPEDCNIWAYFSTSLVVYIKNIDATIRLRSGWNNTKGAYLTDDMGNEYIQTSSECFYFTDIPPGEYTAEIVAEGYVKTYVNVVSTAKKYRYLEFCLVPELPEDTYTLELCYASETEIDSVAMYYENGKLIEKDPAYSGESGLNIMDRYVEYNDSSYQREVIFLHNTDKYLGEKGLYKYCLYAYDDTGSNNLSMSQATIRLYKGNELIETYTIPVNRKGNTCQMLILDNEGWHFYWEFSDEDSIEDVQ